MNLTSLLVSVVLGATPSVVVSTVTPVVADTQPLLTEDVLVHMTTFWSTLAKDSAVVRNMALAEQDSLVQPQPDTLKLTVDLGRAGRKTFLATAVNMVALAAQFPSVAAALQQAGLTAPQWEQYRQVLYDASLTLQVAERNNYTPTPTSAIGRNVAFLKSHSAAVDTLRASGMWFPPVRPGMGADTTVVLTINVMKRIAKFWTLLLAEPSAISDTVTQQYRYVSNYDDAEMERVVGVVLVGEAKRLDVEKLSRRYPAVAADLQQAGLTVQDYENIEKSLETAWVMADFPEIWRNKPAIPPNNKWSANIKLYRQYAGFYRFMFYSSLVLSL